MASLERSRNIAEQNASYRRGVVQGLTMAEVAVLLIFVLLLLIGFSQWDEAKRAEGLKGQTSVSNQQLEKLKQDQRELIAVKEAVQAGDASTSEEIETMIRAVREASRSPTGQSALQQVKSVLKELDRVKQELARRGYPQDLVDKVERQSFQLSNQQGQLARYEKQLQNLGLGKGERPCWVKPDGTIEFLYDVVLSSNGIRMRENLLPSRTQERATLPMPVSDPSENLTDGEFLRRTQPLYESSLAANCRFFVTVFDATGPAEKERYKGLLRTVEGHFYKRLSLDSAPF